KPVSPQVVKPSLPKELEGIIGRAMEKDREKRYHSAADMKADLQRLKRETESGMIRTGIPKLPPLRRVTTTFQTSSTRQKYLLLGMAGLLITVLAAVGAWWFKHRALLNASLAGKNTIAVLPLRNLNNESSVDYLRFAL